MRITIYLSFFLLLLIACKHRVNEMSIKKHFSDKVSENKSVSVYLGDEKIQEVKIENQNVEEAELIDWNFDGIKDLSLRCIGGTGGQPYEVWLYSKKEKQFVLNQQISGRNLFIDSINKRIVFYRRDGFELEVWDTMKFQNDKLILDRGTALFHWNDQNGDTWEKVHSVKFRNGKYTEKVDSNIIK